TRLLAIIGKELVEVARRPGALLSLVFGPFLVMALFGLGYNNTLNNVRAMLVVDPGSGLSKELADYRGFYVPGAELVDVVTDASVAHQALEDRRIDVVILVPADLLANFEAGKQSTIRVEYDLISPAKAAYANLLAGQLSYAVNQTIIERAVAQGVSGAGKLGQQPPISPTVVAAPIRTESTNLAPIAPTLTSFFGPAVLALILQHMAVTLTALSLVRERHTGVFDVLRVSPVSSVEIIVGKMVAFGILGAVVAFAVLALMGTVLGVPMAGDPRLIAAFIGLVLAASLGLGLLISVVSDSERQAVQLALLVLLGSVFFSGFLLDLEQFAPPMQVVGNLLPVTQGIRLLQDLLLRGSIAEAWRAGVLGAIALVTMSVTWFVLRRDLSARA
ncbi:MAG: ABC transporter permease, partial [Candidatus Limnocylindrales bacterium]